MAGLKIQQQDREDTGHFILSGSIDDLSDFKQIASSSSTEITLDLGDIEDINSYGVKIWSQCLLQIKNKKIAYKNCRPPIIRQLNVVINLRKNVQILSFYVPFECTSCLIETEILYQSSTILSIGLDRFLTENIQQVNCSRCAGTMEFMDDETAYFKFLG